MKNSLKTQAKLVVLSSLVILLSSTGIYAQQTKDVVFRQANNSMSSAKSMQADLLSPTEYAKALDYYKDAENKFDNQKGIDKVNERLAEAVKYFDRSKDFSANAKTVFANSLNAREDALSAGANVYASKKWSEAENQFKKAAEQMEKGNRDNSYEESVEAMDLYRKAELSAIKTHLLDETRNILKTADQMDVEDNAPKTLAKAKKLLAEAEKELGTNRYDMDYPRILAKQAKYEANHAIYLHKTIRKLEDEDQEFEDVLLNSEKPLINIAEASEIVAQFDEGFDKPQNKIISYVTYLQEKNIQLSIENNIQSHLITQKDNAIAVLSREREALNKEFEKEIGKRTAEMNSKMQIIEDEKVMLAKKVDFQTFINERFNQVKQLFDSKDAVVLRSGNDVIIRMQGFGFDVGKSDIKPEYFNMLTKVQNAISIFPDSKVIVEGYTDSFGGDASNLKLSQERSDAVTTYLKANMPTLNSGNISSVGHGENNPVANNETREGRSKNRRIDIIINNNNVLFTQHVR